MTDAEFSERCEHPEYDDRDQAEFLVWLGRAVELEAIYGREQFEEETIETDGLAVELVNRFMAAE